MWPAFQELSVELESEEKERFLAGETLTGRDHEVPWE